MSAVVDVWGWRARFALARGQTITDVIAKLPAIESGLGTFRGAARVYPTPDDLANRFELRVLDNDPHADAITWPGPSVASITEPIDLGPFEDATPARVLLLRRHALIGGVSGSGKSGGLNVLMGNLSACADVVIWAIDLKRGMELGPWASCIDRLATTPAEARALLADAVAILEARAALLAATGQRVWDTIPGHARPGHHRRRVRRTGRRRARRHRRRRLDRPARPGRRRHPDRRDPAADAEGHGPGRAALADGRADLLPRPRTQRRRPHPRTGHARRRLARPHPQRPRQVPHLRTRTRHPAPRPRLPAHRPGRQRHRHLARHPRPALDEVSARALEERAQRAQTAPPVRRPDHADPDEDRPADTRDAAGTMLWAALSLAPEEGISVPDLMAATGMGRPWVYYRLRELADAGRAIQASAAAGAPPTRTVTTSDRRRSCARPRLARVCTYSAQQRRARARTPLTHRYRTTIHEP